MTNRPLVLLTNDDGHLAAGIHALREAMSAWADVIVCAPETEQSATSHALSLHRPLRLRKVDAQIFAVDGTPADCVYVALFSGTKVLPRRPDLVVSGLNHGPNLGADVFYSGTVGGAREGALRGIPSVAASADTRASRPAAARFASGVIELFAAQIASESRPFLLNLNVPSGDGPWPLRSTVLGSRLYSDEVIYATDPRGREYLWIGGTALRHDFVAGSDTDAFDRGEASLTPLQLDLTDHGGEAVASALVARVRGQAG